TTPETPSAGRLLFARAGTGGAQALQQPMGELAPGRRADIVLLDPDHPDMANRDGDRWLDAWIFTAGRAAVKTVLVGGNTLVEDGRPAGRPPIAPRSKPLLKPL